MAASEGEVNRLVLEIRRYMQARPRAADSAQGIAAWWIAGTQHSGLDAVEAAIERLISDGEIRKQVLPDGKTVYAGAIGGSPGKRN